VQEIKLRYIVKSLGKQWCSRYRLHIVPPHVWHR
jgi:hypothetical protein